MIMETINKMNDKNNTRRDTENTIFGNIKEVIDFHLIENFEIDNIKLKKHFEVLYKEVEMLKLRNERLVEVITELHTENKKIKERLDNYGI